MIPTSAGADAQIEEGFIGLRRPCPVCSNSRTEDCEITYILPEFEVLLCHKCGVSFINQIVDDNVGISLDTGLARVPSRARKAAIDFELLKSRLKQCGVTDFHGWRLLDVGCATGIFLLGPQRDGWAVAGLELNSEAVAYARGKHGLSVICGSIEANTSFDAQSFDLITLFGVIEPPCRPGGSG